MALYKEGERVALTAAAIYQFSEMPEQTARQLLDWRASIKDHDETNPTICKVLCDGLVDIYFVHPDNLRRIFF